VRRAGPLAIDYLVEVIRVANVAGLQNLSPEILFYNNLSVVLALGMINLAIREACGI
jgi:hypothetical protein